MTIELVLACLTLYPHLNWQPPRVRARRVGGLRFLRIGRYQFSFCRCRQSI